MTHLDIPTDLSALPEAPALELQRPPAASAKRRDLKEIVRELAAMGAGGAVCHAAGFAESGGRGLELQAALIAAAGDMPILGPNCYGTINYLDGALLWFDQHGGKRPHAGAGRTVAGRPRQ